MVRLAGVEPVHPKILDPKSSASTNFATGAHGCDRGNLAKFLWSARRIRDSKEN